MLILNIKISQTSLRTSAYFICSALSLKEVKLFGIIHKHHKPLIYVYEYLLVVEKL